ncbi:MAG: hypothetical protein QW660_03465 [Candidatus Bathyarchaeia archaeon]
MEQWKRVIDLRIDAENMPAETVILIPTIMVKHEKAETYSETIVISTTTDAGFYRAWEAHFYWEAFRTVSQRQ